jgi:beta-1,4-mannosyl-glycoprotein beta-1,4-N-acetylglucosaminyltransferase
MIYDCFTLRDELDILELRLKILGDVVDKFVISEASTTFTNQPKELYYQNNADRFKKWADKIIYLPFDLETEGMDFNVKGPQGPAWQMEYQQRNGLILGLEGAKDDDLILVGDVDEMPDPKIIPQLDITKKYVFVMGFYYYYANNRMAADVSHATTAMSYKSVKEIGSTQTIRDIRHRFTEIRGGPWHGGWHLSFAGGKEYIKKKIQSFAHTEFDSESYWGDANIDKCLEQGVDIFKRNIPFKMIKLEDEYPEYVLKHIMEYPFLIWKKNENTSSNPTS